MYSMGQAFAQPLAPLNLVPGGSPVPHVGFYEDREGAAGTYRGVSTLFVMPFKAAMVGWKVREGADPNVIDLDATETADLTPYNESTGPRDPGDGFRWIENRWQQGRGILVVPPATWQPGDDIMRATTGNVHLVASEDVRDRDKIASAASPGGGFVLYEPRSGEWKGEWAQQPPEPDGKLPKWVVPVGAGAAAIVIGLVAFKSLKRR
jgi:hypothetical protein